MTHDWQNVNSPAGSSDVQFYAKKPHILLLYTLYWAMAKLPPKSTSIYLLDSLRFVGKATPIFEVFIFFTIRHNRFHSQCACNIVFMAISKCCRSNTRGIHYLKAIYFYKILISDGIALDLLFFSASVYRYSRRIFTLCNSRISHISPFSRAIM